MIDRLTKRQREVLELVAEGLTNREVGERLGISQRTVEIHRKDAIIALGVETTVAAVLVLERARARTVLAEANDLLRVHYLALTEAIHAMEAEDYTDGTKLRAEVLTLEMAKRGLVIREV